jgi:FkbM family methyltransferase
VALVRKGRVVENAAAGGISAGEVPTVTFEGARFADEGAGAVAEERGASPVVCVVDPGGELVYVLRPDSAEPGQVEATTEKARATAAAGKRAGSGAEPLEQDGNVVGAIGVSGARSADEDDELARIGADAIANGHYRPYRVAGGLIDLDVEESPAMLRRAQGLFEAPKVRALQQLLKPGMTFVDIGSNKGDFALLAAKVMEDRGRVLAFEPVPDNLHWLRKSVALNGYESVEIVEIALSDANGRVPIYLGPWSGWHSLLPVASESGETIEVTARTLDSFMAEQEDPRVDVIKIDVEGAEMQVLHGAARTLAEARPLTVFVECHPGRGVDQGEVWQLLAGHGLSFRDPADINVELPEMPGRPRDIVAVRT